MSKQVFNSFKELEVLVPEDQRPVATDKKAKNTSRVIMAKKKRPAKVKSGAKPAKARAKKAAPAKPMDPKLKAIFDALDWLRQTFPKTFFRPPQKLRPLKIGIGQDIAEFINTKENPEYSLTMIRKALTMYTKNYRYLTACTIEGNKRIDLEGNEASEITAEQAEFAATKLAELQKRRSEKQTEKQSAKQEEKQEEKKSETKAQSKTKPEADTTAE